MTQTNLIGIILYVVCMTSVKETSVTLFSGINTSTSPFRARAKKFFD